MRPWSAFAVFTDGILSWWPVGEHSFGGDKIDRIVFDTQPGGRVYEIHHDGTQADWADVVAYDRPNWVVLRWHPDPKGATRPSTELEVRFSADGD